MITAIKADSNNLENYTALYDEASDILRGYKRVRTYDASQTYYVRNDEPQSAEDVYIKLDIKDLNDFTNAISLRKFLYVQNIQIVDGEEKWIRSEQFNPLSKITTLEEYFSWLSDLGQADRKYTVLPLDEPHFTIDADSRVINIPPEFKKNGIGVQGDELAEVVYFKIDRYYDYMDLNNTEIFIQWETPGKDSVKGLSPAYYRDITSEPGKLIFGWAISDAITATSGTLKISVRFYQMGSQKNEDGTEGEKAVMYSFSTLTAAVAIQPGMNFDLKTNTNIDDAGVNIIGRLQNSVVAGGYAAAAPVFEKGKNLDNTKEYDLDKDTNTYDLYVQAYATDTGSISYSWKHQDLSGTVQPVISVNDYVEVEDLTNLSKSYAYYTRATADNGNTVIWPEYRDFEYKGDIKTPLAEDVKNGLVLYTKQSKCTANAAGSYYAIATNRITNNAAETKSNEAVFPGPKPIIITSEPEKNIILIENEDGEFEANLRIDVANEDGVLSYIWERDDDDSQLFEPNAANFVKVTDADNGEAELTAVTPGHYRVKVTNTRNLVPIETYSNKIYRVTKKAEVPSYRIDGNNRFEITQMSGTNVPTIAIDADTQHDWFEVKWYLFDKGTSYLIDTHNLPFNQDAEEYIDILDLTDSKYTKILADIKAQNPDFDDDLEGLYYPIVTNHLNEDPNPPSTEVPEDTDNDMFWIV